MKTKTLLPSTEGAIWDRMLEPNGPALSAALANDILALEFPQIDKERMHELAAKARTGARSASDG